MPNAPRPVDRPPIDHRPSWHTRYPTNWPKIRLAYLRANPFCDSCGGWHRLQVHHRDGITSHNDPSNLQTLCISCHNALHSGR